MNRKLLSLLVLLMTAATSAWAKQLYLVIDPSDNTKATLIWDVSGREYPYFLKYFWNENGYSNFNEFRDNCTEITVDASCQDYDDSLHGLFANWSSLETINNIGNLNTFSAKDMGEMFSGCSALTTLDLSGWDTSNVEDMSSMFSRCWVLYTLDLSGWDTSNVKKMNYMFENCYNLKTIYVGDGWKTTNVTKSDNMFDKCSHLPNFNSSYTDCTKAYVLSDGYLTATTVNLTANQGDTGEYWATFYNTQGNYLAPEGTQVFKVALAGTTLTMNEIADGIVNKGEGVVLKKTTSGSITLTANDAASTEDDYSGNSLQGTTTSITNPGNAYVLNKTATNGVGFYKLSSGGSIGANKAYLVSGTGAPEFFGFNENTTAINEHESHKSHELSGEYYDLQGRKIANSQKPKAKGLYIVNGKKMVLH